MKIVSFHKIVIRTFKRVNMSLYTVEHHDMKACAGVELYFHAYLT